MKAKLKILRKTSSTVQTKYGPKEKHAFQLEGSKGPFWADCFANSITAEWREGDIQEMEIVPREYQGKTYYNIVTPKPADLIFECLKRIEEKIDRMLESTGNELPPEADMSEPPPDDSDIPF